MSRPPQPPTFTLGLPASSSYLGDSRSTSTPHPAWSQTTLTQQPNCSQRVVACLPSLDSLAAPERLFNNLLPHIAITVEPGTIVIQGSHQPTIRLLEAYIRQHAGDNYSQKVKGSEFFEGALFSRAHVTLAPDNTLRLCGLNIAFILAFLVSVCGYELNKTEYHYYFLSRKIPFFN